MGELYLMGDISWELHLIETVKNQCIKMMMIKVIIFHTVVLVYMWLWSEGYLFLRSQWLAWESFLATAKNTQQPCCSRAKRPRFESPFCYSPAG